MISIKQKVKVFGSIANTVKKPISVNIHGTSCLLTLELVDEDIIIHCFLCLI